MRGLVYPKMTAVCQDSRQLGQAAFERVMQIATRESPIGAGQPKYQAWFEVNETTAPPPEAPMHVLPNRMRVPASRSHASR
jgi:DNA-binding LacI/PurR family transcriptional regulator